MDPIFPSIASATHGTVDQDVPVAELVEATLAIRISARSGKGKPPTRWSDESLDPKYAGLAVGAEIEVPSTYQEAMQSPNASEWLAAMEEEIGSLKLNGTWVLTEKPEGKTIIKNRWIFKVKRDQAGKVNRFKARLLAKGFTQLPGIDYDETFSPVVKHDSLRTILAVAATLDLEIAQLDVKTASLYEDLEEELYMVQPAGFTEPGKYVWSAD